MAYNWPGNIREMENFAEKLVILEGNLTPEMMEALPTYKDDTIELEPIVYHSKLKTELKTLADSEKELIQNTLELLKNNMSQSAKSLGISRNDLYKKIRLLGLRN